jgi:hypothetical protein
LDQTHDIRSGQERSAILDKQARRFTVDCGCDPDPSACLVVADSVVDQIVEQVREQCLAAPTGAS